jgi:hypothetical protein
LLRLALGAQLVDRFAQGRQRVEQALAIRDLGRQRLRTTSPSAVTLSAAARWSPLTPARAISPRVQSASTAALTAGLPSASRWATREAR